MAHQNDPSSITSGGATNRTNRGGRRREWAAPRARRLTRLYCYTSLKVDEILKVLEDEVWSPGKESANKHLNHLLGEDPRWITSRGLSEARQRMAGLKNSQIARSIDQGSSLRDREWLSRLPHGLQKELLKPKYSYTLASVGILAPTLNILRNFNGTNQIKRLGVVEVHSDVTFHGAMIRTLAGQKGSQKWELTAEGSQHHMPTQQEIGDTYQSTTTSSLTTIGYIDDKNQNHEKKLASWLFHDFTISNTGISNITKVSSSLPHLLQIFAFKMSKELKDKASQSAMLFILKNRSSISNEFELIAQELLSAINRGSQRVPETRFGPSLAKQNVNKVEDWKSKLESKHDPNLPLDLASDAGKPIYTMVDSLCDLEEDCILGVVIKSRAYQWLLAKLRNEAEVVVPTVSVVPSLSEVIFRKLSELRQYSRKAKPPRLNAVFDVEWSPHSFLKEQEYGVAPEESVVKALVLVGTITQAEGMACGDYLLRQWPESAIAFMRLIQSVVKGEEGISHTGKLSDDTKIQAIVKDGHFVIKACGHLDSVIEIGEQLMWISCALRSSNFKEAGICEPSIRDVSVTNSSESCVSMHANLAATPKFAKLSESESGTCWQELFQNPLVVGCYPIISRCSGSALGLQLSISTLLALIQNSRLTSYMGKLFIKSFSTLLVAVKLVDNIILWHAISNKDGSYVYYHDKRADMHGVEVTSSILWEEDIAELRHVVGWTSTADNLAGTSSCNYEIRLSGLTNSRPLEIELEKFTVGFSKIFSGNVSVKFGWRDKPIHTRDGEDSKLHIKHISKHFVVLYDVGDHRGYLLDGATALLHLVRASIVEDQEDGLIDSLPGGQTINDSIQVGNDPDPRRRAMKALWKDENARLRLYKRFVAGDTKTELKTMFDGPGNAQHTTQEINSEEAKWVFFKDRVCDIRWMLDQAINIQTDDTALKTNIKSFMGNTRFEGYEFQDLASSGKADLQFATSRSNGQGWLDLVRRLRAVTLFGRGFGDIIRHNDGHSNGHPLCPDWNSVPTERGFLAMSNATLKVVLERDGSEPWLLQYPFELCKPKGQPCDRKHYLIANQNKKAQKGSFEFPERGAVIIGHETSTMSKLITSIGIRQTHGSDEVIISSGTSAESQQCESPEFEDPSQESASSSSSSSAAAAAADTRSSDFGASATSRTTMEAPQNDSGRSIIMKHQDIAHLSNLIGVHAQLIATSGADTDTGLVKESRSVDLQSNTIVISQECNEEISRISNFASPEDIQGGKAPSIVVADAAQPCILQQLENLENDQMDCHGQKKSIRGGFGHLIRHIQLRPPKKKETRS